MRALWPSENLLLGLLVERPMHGYELARLVCEDEALHAIWHLKRSEVYFLLGKLEAQGYVSQVGGSPQGSEEQLPRGGGPPRQIFEATASGCAMLDAWLSEPVSSPRDLRAAFLAKLYLVQRRDPVAARALLDRQSRVLSEWQGRLRSTAPSDPFLVLANRLRLAQIEAASCALDDIRGMLRAPA